MTENSNDNLWIAGIGALAGILGALGVKEWIPSLFNWLKFRSSEVSKIRAEQTAETKRLHERINSLEKKLENERIIIIRTQTTLKAMLPLMRQIMKDHPEYLELLNQLENQIFDNNRTSADGQNHEV